jgi:hypothetical protein
MEMILYGKPVTRLTLEQKKTGKIDSGGVDDGPFSLSVSPSLSLPVGRDNG